MSVVFDGSMDATDAVVKSGASEDLDGQSAFGGRGSKQEAIILTWETIASY